MAKGDAPAFGTLYGRHARATYSLAYHPRGDHGAGLPLGLVEGRLRLGLEKVRKVPGPPGERAAV